MRKVMVNKLMTTYSPFSRNWVLFSIMLLVTGCVSLGGNERPERLLTLTPTNMTSEGALVRVQRGEAFIVYEPTVPAELDVLRVPVRVNDSSIAYLKDAIWVERPAKLFGRLLAETIRAQGQRVVLSPGITAVGGGPRLHGNLLQFGYDAEQAAVVITYDATLVKKNGEIEQRRFESTILDIEADVGLVGPILNETANDIALKVALWIDG